MFSSPFSSCKVLIPTESAGWRGSDGGFVQWVSRYPRQVPRWACGAKCVYLAAFKVNSWAMFQTPVDWWNYNGIMLTNQYIGDYSNPKFKVNSFRWLPFFPVLSRHFAGPPWAVLQMSLALSGTRPPRPPLKLSCTVLPIGIAGGSKRAPVD